MFRLLTLNLNSYGSQFGSWEKRKDQIIKVIQNEDPDILAFQAVRMEQKRFEGINQAAQISKDLTEYQYVLYQPAVIQENGSTDGCAVLSRFPISIAGYKPLTFQPDLDDPNRRIIQYTCFDLNGNPMHVFNAHLSWVEQQAKTNIEELIYYTDRYQGIRLIVGDFNNTPDSKPIQQMKQHGWIDTWQQLHPGEPGYTFDSGSPRLRIDYVWIDKKHAGAVSDIKILTGSGEDPDGYLSDHFALITSINI